MPLGSQRTGNDGISLKLSGKETFWYSPKKKMRINTPKSWNSLRLFTFFISKKRSFGTDVEDRPKPPNFKKKLKNF